VRNGTAGMRRSLGLALGLLLGLLALALLLGRGARPALRGPDEPAGVTGRVLGGDGPLAGARVRFKGTAVSTLTDSEGRFRLPPGGGRITAWKDGFLVGGATPSGPDLTLRLTSLPGRDNESYEWVDPAPDPASEHNCGNCHAEIYAEWRASGHSRSVTGRHFRGLYEGTDWEGRPGVGWGLLTQHPDGAGVCSSCHAPTVPEDDPALLDLRSATGVHARGVHCDYCHKVAGLAGGEVGLAHGRFNLRLLRPARGQLFFGPLDDVDRGEDAYSALYRDSRYCASCHEGVVFGVHVYSTYSEWLRSPARREGKHCQDCHMAPTGTMTNVAPRRGGVERDPKTLANHSFFRGSRADMLRDCLRLALDWRGRGEGTRVDLRVAVEGAGHSVPTGFVDRNLVLVVEGFAQGDRPLGARSGPTLPPAAGKGWAGQSGKLYAKLLADGEGHSPAPFWKADPSPLDTRLTPGRPDDLSFVFPAGLRRVRVRLLYRRFWEPVARRKGWPDTDLVVLERSYRIGR
jgi:hypothetical protein